MATDETTPAHMNQAALSRRTLLRSALAISGGAAASALLAACGGKAKPTSASDTAVTGTTTGAVSPVATGATPGSAVAAAPAFTRQASITEWGFGVEETNPLAFARVEAFKKAYPSIKLEIVPKVEDQKILTGAAAKQLPDLLWLDRTTLSSWAARGVLKPLDAYIQRDKFDLGRFNASAVSEVKYDNKMYGVPQFMTVRPLYVNTDALKAAGVDATQLDAGNWDTLTDLGKQITKRRGDKVDRWGFDPKVYTQTGGGFLYLWGLGNGGTFLSADGKKATFNDPKIVDALDWGVKSYAAQGGFTSYQAVSSTWQNDEQFARGQVAMTLYENWMLGIIARVAPDLNFTVLPVKKRGGSAPISFTTGNAWTITANAKEPDAAWEFIKFMNDLNTWQIGANAVKEYQKKNGKPYIPTLTGDKAADQMQINTVYEPIAPKFDSAVKLMPQLLDTSLQSPISASPVSRLLDDDLGNEGTKPALSGDKSAKEALDRANDKAQKDIDTFKS